MVFLWAIIAPLTLAGCIRMLLPSTSFDLDFDTAHATFFFLYQHLSKTIWAVFWTGILGSFAAAHFLGDGRPAILLLLSGIYALVLNVWILTTYERYLHSRYPRGGGVGSSNYTAGKYAVTLALSACTLLALIAGLAAALSRMPVRW